ncbi:MAG: hypothetical protein LBB85_01420 [Dysgonamonadaceae bacterium]|jgi:peptidoglycan hydrolase CwlO-like protein|nr:hypothetical protein [Dysgonamonadaceae bacterium]
MKYHGTKTKELEKNIPALQAIMTTIGRRKEEFHELKTNLSALNQKIEVSVKPIEQSVDK